MGEVTTQTGRVLSLPLLRIGALGPVQSQGGGGRAEIRTSVKAWRWSNCCSVTHSTSNCDHMNKETRIVILFCQRQDDISMFNKVIITEHTL